jgi:hypothetical protein
MAVNRTGSDNDRGSQFLVAETSRSPGVGGVSLGQRTSMPANRQHSYIKGISRVYQGYIKGISRVYQGYIKGISRAPTVSFTRVNDFGRIMRRVGVKRIEHVPTHGLDGVARERAIFLARRTSSFSIRRIRNQLTPVVLAMAFRVVFHRYVDVRGSYRWKRDVRNGPDGEGQAARDGRLGGLARRPGRR